MKNTEYWGEARNFLHVTMRNMGVKKYLPSPTEHISIVVELSSGPELSVPDAKPIIRISPVK